MAHFCCSIRVEFSFEIVIVGQSKQTTRVTHGEIKYKIRAVSQNGVTNIVSSVYDAGRTCRGDYGPPILYYLSRKIAIRTCVCLNIYYYGEV